MGYDVHPSHPTVDEDNTASREPVAWRSSCTLHSAFAGNITTAYDYVEELTDVTIQTVQSCVDNFRARKASERSADPEVVFDSLSALPNHLIHAEATDILVAGSDTTATTLAVGLYQLTQNPVAYEALKKEIREANLKTAKDFDLKLIEQLPYLVRMTNKDRDDLIQ